MAMMHGCVRSQGGLNKPDERIGATNQLATGCPCIANKIVRKDASERRPVFSIQVAEIGGFQILDVF